MTDTMTDEEILFPQATVGDIIVRPWSFGKLFEISALLGSVLDKAEEKGIVEELEKTGDISYITLVKLFTLASEEVLKIIASTTEKLEEEISMLSMEDGIQLSYVIFRQNRETIKNAFAPLLVKLDRTSEGKTDSQ